MKTVVIIPARMASQRFPNKPLELIDGIPMIQRVWNKAIKSKVGDVYVACCEKEVFNLINNIGGNAIITNPNLPSGTDRIHEALQKIENNNKYESIINLQGDMPLINPKDISKANDPIKYGYSIGTLATNITILDEENINVTKVKIKWVENNFIGEAIDFYKKSNKELKNIYHHVGIYSFTPKALKRFINLKPSEKELKYKLEQWRALQGGIKIGISYVKDIPLGVDTKEDLINVENIIKNSNEKNK